MFFWNPFLIILVEICIQEEASMMDHWKSRKLNAAREGMFSFKDLAIILQDVTRKCFSFENLGRIFQYYKRTIVFVIKIVSRKISEGRHLLEGRAFICKTFKRINCISTTSAFMSVCCFILLNIAIFH